MMTKPVNTKKLMSCVSKYLTSALAGSASSMLGACSTNTVPFTTSLCFSSTFDSNAGVLEAL